MFKNLLEKACYVVQTLFDLWETTNPIRKATILMAAVLVGLFLFTPLFVCIVAILLWGARLFYLYGMFKEWQGSLSGLWGVDEDDVDPFTDPVYASEAEEQGQKD